MTYNYDLTIDLNEKLLKLFLNHYFLKYSMINNQFTLSNMNTIY